MVFPGISNYIPDFDSSTLIITAGGTVPMVENC